ncbi:MAG: hypothetical protein LW875_08390, partial [Proteobacteria bacterium]|nr:hypothetical protein [Pseudomonadota bacterium]
NEKPIAYVTQINEDVHRRPTTRLLWQLLDSGEALFPGEAIRTSAEGEVRIQFSGTDRFLDLEPGSLILISQGKRSEISLDLLDGSFFVAQKEGSSSSSDGPALTLKSESGVVDLSKATAQLSKTQGKPLDVQVIKGTAKLETATGQTKEISAGQSSSQFQILKPSLEKPFFVNPEAIENIGFEWIGAPSSSTVTLWTGKTRKNLSSTSTVSTSSQLTHRFLPGRHFWKLVAQGPSGEILAESSIYRLEVIGQYTPQVLSPKESTDWLLAKNGPLVDFKWTTPEGLESVLLEVSKENTFNQPVHRKSYSPQQSATQLDLKEGAYFYRINARYPGIPQLITSKIYQFQVKQDLAPPPPPKPPVVIGWITPVPTAPEYYLESPLINLAWVTEQKDQVSEWRLKIAESEEQLKSDQAESFELQETQKTALLKKPGRYIAMVEALDKDKKVIASSSFRNFEIQPKPLLKAPRFLPLTGDFQADNDGQLDLSWEKLSGVKEYWFQLLDARGKELQKVRFKGNSTKLNNLLPGEYQILIYAVDEHGRKSTRGNTRKIIVPESSGIQAPILKRIKVE